MTPSGNPTKGEVWNINFDPSLGQEIQKTRPAVVISEPTVGRLKLRIVVPITEWNPAYLNLAWFVNIPHTQANGLGKESGADAFQVKSVSISRFGAMLGTLTPAQLDDIASAIAICVGAP